MSIISVFKKIWPLLLVLPLVLFTLYPAIFLPIGDGSYQDLGIIKGDDYFGKDLNFLHPPLIYYFLQYGTQFAAVALAYQLFDFNSQPYFILSIILRVIASISIYYFVSKWSKNKSVAVISSLFFGINTAGIQVTTRATLFQTYVAIIIFFIFLDRYFTFHNKPGVKKLIVSIMFFLLTIFAHPIRMVGTVFLTFGGEIYFLFEKIKDKVTIKLRIHHLIIFLLSLFVLIFMIGTINATLELSYKRVTLPILMLALFNGYPPVITSFFFFISNLYISPLTILYGYLSIQLLQYISWMLPFFGILFLINFLTKKKFLLAFFCIPAIIFSPLVAHSSSYLEDWMNEWIVITQIGGTLFLIMNVILLQSWNKNRSLAQIGFLGTIIVLANLLLPWLISPEKTGQDQSAFNFIHRYYTVPSIGTGILMGSTFVICLLFIKDIIDSLNESKRRILKIFQLIKLLFLNITYIIIPVLIIYIIFTQIITTREHLIRERHSIDAAKTDLLWFRLEPTITKLIGKSEVSIIYLEFYKDFNQTYLDTIFKIRIPIHTGELLNPPKVDFIFDKDELYKILREKEQLIKTNSLYAFRFDGNYLVDIKDEIISSVNKK